MGSEGNNTTLLEDLTYNKSNAHVVFGYEKWPIEKCIDTNIINDTKTDDLSFTFQYNGSQIVCLDHAPVLSKSTIIRASVLSAMAIFSFFGNLATIAVVFRVARGPFFEEFYQCVTHGFHTERWQEQAYITLSLIFMFILPLLILISTYVSTVRTIAKSEKVFKPEVIRQEKYLTPDMNRRILIDRAKMKSLRISVVIVAAFIIWWTPYYKMMIMFTFLNPDKNGIWPSHISHTPRPYVLSKADHGKITEVIVQTLEWS